MHTTSGDIPGSLPKESGLVAFDEDGWKDDFASPTALQEDWERNFLAWSVEKWWELVTQDASPAAPVPELPESLMGEAWWIFRQVVAWKGT